MRDVTKAKRIMTVLFSLTSSHNRASFGLPRYLNELTYFWGLLRKMRFIVKKGPYYFLCEIEHCKRQVITWILSFLT